MTSTCRTCLVPLLAMVAVGLYACETPALKEPPDARSFSTYDDLRPALIFRKMAYNPGVDIRDCTRVRVSEIAVVRAVEREWQESAFRGGSNLAFMIGSLRERLHQELRAHFQVLQDDSFIDDQTLVIRVLVTRLSVVKVPRDPEKTQGATQGPPEAAIEFACWRGRSLDPFLKVKDWRMGRQAVEDPVREKGPYADTMTIYRFWARRTADVLVKARTDPSAIR